MITIKIKEGQAESNDTELKVFVVGEPDLSLISESLIDCFVDEIIKAYELEIK